MTNPALWTAISAVIVAVTALVGLFVHSRKQP